MKSERRKQYPKNWEQLARQCKEQAGWKCEHCHITQGKKRISKRTGEPLCRVSYMQPTATMILAIQTLYFSAFVLPVMARMIIVTG